MGHKTLTARRAQNAVTTSLAKLQISGLKNIAANCGVTSSGRKNDIYLRLNQHFKTIIARATQEQIFHADRVIPQSIISFDIGYKNLAHVKINRDNSIMEWTRTDLGLEEFHPSATVPVIRKFIKHSILSILDENVGALVLEQQRYRQNGAPGVFEHTIRVNSVEAMLWYALYDAADNRNITLDVVSRQSVDRMWRSEWEQVHPPLENADTGQKNRHKKAACVKLVDHWLDNDTSVHVSRPELKNVFRMEKKRDDMADCLIQAMTWYRWRQTTLEYIQECYDNQYS